MARVTDALPRQTHSNTNTNLEIPTHRLEDLEAELHDGSVRRGRVEQQRLAEIVPHSQDKLLRSSEPGTAVVHDRQEHFLTMNEPIREGGHGRERRDGGGYRGQPDCVGTVLFEMVAQFDQPRGKRASDVYHTDWALEQMT